MAVQMEQTPPRTPVQWPECIDRIESMEKALHRLDDLSTRIERSLWLLEAMVQLWNDTIGIVKQAVIRLLTGGLLFALAWLALHIRIQP